MDKADFLSAMNGIDDKYIEESENIQKKGFKARVSLFVAAMLIIALSVTALAVAGFFNTVNNGKLVFLEAVGGYSGDVYEIHFDVDIAEDAGYKIKDYYVPMYLEESEDWTDCGGEAGETYSNMAYDNYDENLFVIFYQYPAWNYDNGAKIVYNVPAGTKANETWFEIDGEKIYCIEFQPQYDGYRGDPFGTRVLFWSDGYNLFELEVRLNMDEESVREIIRSVEKVRDISDYIIYKK
ncbi:MAG: hypothetical protein IKU42_02405 [Oscillospiraceae bacterium]|nr:hypothetical protein [Oscillospiraceae bacterium]